MTLLRSQFQIKEKRQNLLKYNQIDNIKIEYYNFKIILELYVKK